jgi:aspartate carbamoyltransferase regulatory subunit
LIRKEYHQKYLKYLEYLKKNPTENINMIKNNSIQQQNEEQYEDNIKKNTTAGIEKCINETKENIDQNLMGTKNNEEKTRIKEQYHDRYLKKTNIKIRITNRHH